MRILSWQIHHGLNLYSWASVSEIVEICQRGVYILLDLEKVYDRVSKDKLWAVPANSAMQDSCGPCKGFPYGTRTDLAAGAAVAPHGLTARVLCCSNYLCKLFLFLDD